MNNKVLVIVAGVIIIILIGIGLYALTSKNDSSTPTDKISLVYWGLWEPETVMQPIIDEYEKANPHIEIQYVQKPFTQYEANAFTRIHQTTVSDTPAPDIIRINNTWLPKFQPYLAPIPSDIMTSTEYSNSFYPTALKDFTGTDGFLYAIPLEIDGLALFYNKSLLSTEGLEIPPSDWDSLIAAGQKLTKTNGTTIDQAGIALGTSKNIRNSADIFNLLLLQNGVEPMNSSGTEITLASARTESAMQFYTDFVDVHKTWSPDLATDLEMFYSGKLAMMFAPSWRAFDIITSAPNIEFGIAPVPQLPGNTPINYSMYWGEAVSRTSPNQQEAWKFIKYLSESEQQKAMFSNSSQIRAFGEPYSLKSLSSELSSHPYLSAFMEMAPTMQSWKMGEQGYIEESINTAINDVVEGGIQINSALSDAETRINEKLLESSQ